MNCCRTIAVLLLGFALLLSADSVAEESMVEGETFSVPVRVLESAAQPAEDAMLPTDGTVPTLPGGKLPQYDLHHAARVETDDPADPRLRLLLTLPGEPLIVDVEITIDGTPFREVREQRIRDLLAQLKQPLVEQESEAAESSGGPVVEEEEKRADETSESEADSDEPAEPEVTKPTVPPYSLPATVLERLRRQQAILGDSVSSDELRWILSEWVDGPTLLFLNRNFQRFRAGQQPLIDILDRDRDGQISADELAKAVESIEECDLNRNDIVDVGEIERSAKDPRRQVARRAVRQPGLLTLPEQDDSGLFFRRLSEACAVSDGADEQSVSRFDTNGDGRLDTDEFEALRAMPADLQVAVAFDTTSPQEGSRLSVSSRSDVAVEPIGVSETPEDVLRLKVKGVAVEFSAVQGAAGDQVSIGSVHDGYPLLATIDPNDDGRLTIRERRTLIDRLRAFDRNQDGALAPEELRAPFRICIGLGPVVHRELANLRRVRLQPTTEAPMAPEWFVRMDRNRDRDLSRSEFPGTNEQFDSLDADGDKLISVDEARATSQSN